MKILLVRPPRMKQAITLGEFMFSEPIGLECIFGVLKDFYEVKILDMMVAGENLLKECSEWKPDVVGLTSLCVDVVKVKELAKEVKAYDENIITIVGGTQTFLNPEAFFCDCIDHVMKYTTRDNLLELFQYINSNKRVPLIDGVHSGTNNFRSTKVEGKNEYILPDRSSTIRYRKHYSYFGFKPCAIIQTSHGCSSCCKFCLRWRIEGAGEKHQPLDCIINEIENIDEPNIMIFDNDFLHDPRRLKAFCELLEKKSINKSFICYGSVRSIIDNSDEISRFAKNGLKAVIVGYETFKEEELIDYYKKSTANDNFMAAALLKDLQIDCWASFIVHPDWSVDDFKRFRGYLRRLRPEITTLSPLTPFPNLPLYEQYKERLLFDREDYTSWSFGKVSINPSKMTLRRYYFEMLKVNGYINLYLNNIGYMINKFGFGTVYRIALGSMRLLWIYIGLMLRG